MLSRQHNLRNPPLCKVLDDFCQFPPRCISSECGMNMTDEELRNETPQVAPKGSQPGGGPIIVETNSPLAVKPRELLGEEPEYIDCPFCRSRAMTKVTHADSTSTTFVWFFPQKAPSLISWRVATFSVQVFADDGQTDWRESCAAC